MKALRFGILVFAVLLVFAVSHAQPVKKPVLSPKAELQLKMPAGEGTNSCSVAWNPDDEKYYSAMVGNESYPLEVFDAKGKHLQTTATGADIRGLWYSPRVNWLEANLYDYQNVIAYELDSAGLLTEEFPEEVAFELEVYEPQAALAYNTETNELLWFEASSMTIYFIDRDYDLTSRYIDLKVPVGDTALNPYCVGYTGVKGYEYAILNHLQKKVYLISDETEAVTATITLPAKAVVPETFGFCFANGRIWLFNNETRTWTAFKVF
ncbi:MAG TPA: hypothetical protein P5228_06030 [Bacteroidales bacterium]|nr:hypothetical protein [Bacteroidales bacterium]HRZ48741.1 hypothetical protein [Bacteroidales bacterium]